MPVRLKGTPKISVGDVEFGAINYGPSSVDTGLLDTSELLSTGSTDVAVTEVTTTDLTISSVGVSTGALTIGGDSVIARQAVQFALEGGTTANSPYTLLVSVQTSSTGSVQRTIKRHVGVEFV